MFSASDNSGNPSVSRRRRSTGSRECVAVRGADGRMMVTTTTLAMVHADT